MRQYFPIRKSKWHFHNFSLTDTVYNHFSDPFGSMLPFDLR